MQRNSSRHHFFTICLLGGCLISLMGKVFAQGEPRKTILKVNPLSILVATANVKVERRLDQRFSAQIAAYIGAPRLAYNADSVAKQVRYFYVGIVPELRYHISFIRVPNPRGLYTSVFGRYAYVEQHYAADAFSPTSSMVVRGKVTLHRHVASIGFLIGYQFMIDDRVALDAYIGPQYSTSQTLSTFTCPTCVGDEQHIAKPGLRFDGIEPRIGLAVGYAF
jgi:Protein of unknown function (DUF3575)